ncbi:hypothetical protein [Pseudomonas chlororaphis]|uniref:hypothetical protein n=1 Tax=Pseudomonas chlororaphis TaxID=587753 RepID=UPI001B30E94B|nr:hypothetical protein [Pseudomonas chlororaphis]QTT90359.1 hypothetical protein HUT28_24175 [Pseudomonas chlororaphis]
MQRMASDYRTGPQTIAVLASGETVSVGTVLKAEVDMLYIVSSITTDGKKIAFDLRELPELADAFAGGGGPLKACTAICPWGSGHYEICSHGQVQ